MVGSATVYSQNELGDEMLDRAREFVAKGMEEGMFDDGIHEGLVGVSYHSTGNDPAVSTSRSTGGDDSTNSAVIWGPIVGVVVVGTAIAAVIAALFVRRNHKKRQQRRPSTDPLGIRPSTREDYSQPEFNISARSSWDVLQNSSTAAQKEELGISARELVHSSPDFQQSSRSSWNDLQSGQDLLVLEEKWEDESVLTG